MRTTLRLCLIAILASLAVAFCAGPDQEIPTFVAPTPAPTPTPQDVEPTVISPTSDPGGRGSNPGPTSAEVERGTCRATISTTGQADKPVEIKYTRPGTEKDPYLVRWVTVPAGGSIQVSGAQAYFERRYEWPKGVCDLDVNVQCDFTAGGGEHIGHGGSRVVLHNSKCDCECLGRFCVTYLSNTGGGYYILDDGQVWKDDLYLHRGNQNTCWSFRPDGSELCLKWRNELIGCARAVDCEEVQAAWHGDVRFRSECVVPD